MKTKYLTIPFVCIGSLYYSQTTIYFGYDEAGNQKYRGPDSNAAAKAPQEDSATVPATVMRTETEEERFWSKIRIYPVPVKDMLTIDWSDEADRLIDNVSLYEHSTVHWKFQQKNLPTLNRRVQVNMTGYYMGVFILRFQLRDGRVYSRNILKQ